MRRLRRSLRPVRSGARRARALLGDLGALLRTPGISAEDIRWVARTAQSRGNHALAEDALFELVRLGKANPQEQQRVRRFADQPAGAGGGQAPPDRTAVWRPEWDVLPRSLADQLAACALTRINRDAGATAGRPAATAAQETNS